MSQAGARKILVACKDGGTRDNLCSILMEKGHEPFSTGSRIDALEVTLRMLPDLVIICLSLDAISTEQFVKIIRANPKTGNTPMICLAPEDTDASPRIDGINAYLKEPVDGDELFRQAGPILGLAFDDGKEPEKVPEQIPLPKDQSGPPAAVREEEGAEGEEPHLIFEDFLESVYTDAGDLFDDSKQVARLFEIGDKPIVDPGIETQTNDDHMAQTGDKGKTSLAGAHPLLEKGAVVKGEPEGIYEKATAEKHLSEMLVLEMENELTGLYRTIESLLPFTDGKVIQLTGCAVGDGTSTVARQFAMVSAFKFGKTVLLMDADFSRPSQHQYFDTAPACSMEEAMRNGNSPERAIFQPLNAPLFVTLVANDAGSVRNLFHEREVEHLFRSLKERFDMIIIDSSPAVASPENRFFSSRSDGVLIVVQADKTLIREAERTRNSVVKGGGNILGVVFNKKRGRITEFN